MKIIQDHNASSAFEIGQRVECLVAFSNIALLSDSQTELLTKGSTYTILGTKTKSTRCMGTLVDQRKLVLVIDDKDISRWIEEEYFKVLV